MLVTQQPVLRRFWYAVIPEARLDLGPQPFTLLGEDIVIWRGADGTPAAVRDRCCHRTAKLSKGYVDSDGLLCCGYHGWSYDCSGKCVRIPQMPQNMIPANARVANYHCKLRYGYVWVALEDPLTDIPDIPEGNDPSLRRIPQFYERWACSGLRFMENSFDNAHFSFVHKNTFGKFASPKPADIEIIENAWGFESRRSVPIMNPPDSWLLTGSKEPETIRHLHDNWYMPFSRRFGCTYPNGLVHTIVNCATPIDDKSTMMVQWLYRNDTEQQAPAEELVKFDHAVTREDKEILEATDYDAPIDTTRRMEFHMPSDKPGLVMRKKLMALLQAHGEKEVHL